MTIELTITPKQAALIAEAQRAKETAERALNLVCAAVLAGHDAEGRIVALDTDKHVIHIEVPDEAK